jgi:hypothetical protein
LPGIDVEEDREMKLRTWRALPAWVAVVGVSSGLMAWAAVISCNTSMTTPDFGEDPCAGLSGVLVCDDQNACTIDACNATTGSNDFDCTHQPVVCSNGLECDTATGECV